MRRCVRSALGSCTSFVNDTQRIEFVVVMLIEPRADKVEQPNTCAPRKGKGVCHQLRDWSFKSRLGLVVQYVDGVVANLQEVDMAGERLIAGPGEREIRASLL